MIIMPQLSHFNDDELQDIFGYDVTSRNGGNNRENIIWLENTTPNGVFFTQSSSRIKRFDCSLFPNPFNSQPSISCLTHISTPFDISIRDLQGRLIEIIAHNAIISKNRNFTYTPTGLPSGTYQLYFTSEESYKIETVTFLK